MRRLNDMIRGLPLALKVSGMMTLIVVTTVISVTVLALHREQRSFQHELQQKSEMILALVTVVASDALYTLDADTLSHLMQQMGTEHLLVVGRIYGKDGRILADAYAPQARFRTEPDPVGQHLIGREQAVFDWQPEQLVTSKAVRVGRTPIGAISIGLSTAPLTEKIATMQRQGFGAALVATLVGVLLTFLLSRSITNPVRELTAATERVAAGDLSHMITTQNGDELARLAQAFNRMTGRLHNMMIEQAEQRTALADTNTQLQHTLAEVTAAQQVQARLVETIHGLSLPILSLGGQVLLIPLIGRLDAERGHLLIERTLDAIERLHARRVILDVTGVPMIDDDVATTVIHTAQAAQLLGAETMLCGISPHVAQTLVSLDLALTGLTMVTDLQMALTLALQTKHIGQTRDG